MENKFFKRIRRLIIFAGCFILLLILFDWIFDPTEHFGLHNFPPVQFILSHKEYIFIFIQILFLVLIFWFQEVHQKSQYAKLQQILEKVNDKILSMSPLEQLGKQIHNEVNEWLKEDNENIVVFYFPYSILPGFWFDTGKTFAQFLSDIETQDVSTYKHSLYFIGPDENDSPFSQAIEKLQNSLTDEKFVKDHIKGDFYGGFDFATFDENKIEECLTRIKEKYKSRLNQIESNAANKGKIFKVLKIGSSCPIKKVENLPSFSFILKINKSKKNEMILIDTFKTLEDSNLLSNVISQLGIDKITPEILLAQPSARIVNNKQVTNLFLTTFLESCCQSQEFNDLRTHITTLN